VVDDNRTPPAASRQVLTLFMKGLQSHLVITKAQNSGSFVRYGEVSEGIPYSEVCLNGSMGINFQKVHS